MKPKNTADYIDTLLTDVSLFMARHFVHSKIQRYLTEKIKLFNSPPFVLGIQPHELSVKYYQGRFLSLIEQMQFQIAYYSSAVMELKRLAYEVQSIYVNPAIEQLCEQVCSEIDVLRGAFERELRAKHDRRVYMVKQILYGTQNTQISDSPIYLPRFSEE